MFKQRNKMNKYNFKFKQWFVFVTLFFLVFTCFLPFSVLAQDSDGDGYSDEEEIRAGYSPYNKEQVEVGVSDMDEDGVSDYFEYIFQTNPYDADSDGDGYSDFEEIDNAYNPLLAGESKLAVRVIIDLSEQKMDYYVNGKKWRSFLISSGKPSMQTPVGMYQIVNKSDLAWSASYGLYMPFWLGFDRNRIGIHELPIWPSGYREGEDHLGKAVSHGCIRLGVGAAEYVYNRLQVGDRIEVVE